MDLQQLIILGLKGSIFLTVFAFGLQATKEDILHLVRRPSLLVRSLAAMFIVMPLFALTIARLFDLHPAVKIALVALALSPVPPVLPQREVKAGGRSSYALGLMATAALLSIVFIPAALHLLGRFLDRPLDLAPGVVASLALTSVLVPLAAGMAFRAAFRSLADRITKPVSRFASVLLALGAVAVLVTALPSSLRLIGNGTVLALVAFVAVGLAVGHALGGPVRDDRIVLALSTACRHPAIALAIAAATFPTERAAVAAIVLYLLINIVVAIPYVTSQRHAAPARFEPASTRSSRRRVRQ